MPFQYQHHYFFGPTEPGADTDYPLSNDIVTTITDEDGPEDDFISAGGDLSVEFDTGVTATGTLVGTTQNGDPLIAVQFPDNPIVYYYIPSDDPNLTGPVGPISGNLPCFLEGTVIATSTGERRVEDLRIGDLVLTADGRAVPVLWVGHRTLKGGARADSGALPVRIAAGALGDGLPHTDLFVTSDHGMVLDGHVVTAAALVDGDSIDWVPEALLGAGYTVYHVETEAHDAILANGAAAETLIDAAGRAAFDNHDAYLAHCGAERIIPEMRMPRITSQRLLPDALRCRLGLDMVEGFDGTARSA